MNNKEFVSEYIRFKEECVNQNLFNIDEIIKLYVETKKE